MRNQVYHQTHFKKHLRRKNKVFTS